MKLNKILIANRGEIAVRILKTLNKLQIPGVVIYHAADAESPAVRLADEAAEIFGDTPVAAYLNIDGIVAACHQTGADAVHPGFGFLAENGEFARRLAKENIKFIGPTPDVINLMGNKISARQFAIDNHIPVVPSVTQRSDRASFIHEAAQIGFPLLLKAAAGGGGKGMNIVHQAEDLDAAMTRTANEAQRAFGDGTLYAEKYIQQPRHIEVQVLADEQGHVLHLGERECTLQRRFQKVVEEAPSPVLTADLRAEICQTAVRLAQAANYHNAGTVEFILAPDNAFYFLEMNTRLQVEHPVTEMITGIDLVAEQIKVASGQPLVYDQAAITFSGHAIECRLYAEDPAENFSPTTGPILIYDPAQGDGVRIESGIEAGMQVTAAFDPMLAKLITYGETRPLATARMQKALSEFVLLGFQTNIDWLNRLVSHPKFETADFHTGFIQERADELAAATASETQKAALAVGVALAERTLASPEYQPLDLHAMMGEWRN